MGTSYDQLSLDERCAIASLHAAGHSDGQIAARLDRPASTIWRELKRNTGTSVGYDPVYAHEQARARRWRGSRLARQPACAGSCWTALQWDGRPNRWQDG